MSGARQQALSARLAGLAVVLALHGVLFYSLWHARVPPRPSEATTLFVELLTEPVKLDSVKPEPARLEPVKPEPPRPKPVKREKPVQLPQQLVARTPAVLPSDRVAPPPPPEPVPAEIEAPVKPAPPAPPAPPPRPAGPGALSGELALTCPDRAPPTYPAISRRLGEEGKVILRVELDETGRVDRATVQTSSGFTRIDEAALATVKRWRCNPATRDGVAVRAAAIQPFNFVLEGR